MAQVFDLHIGDEINIGDGQVVVRLAYKSGNRAKIVVIADRLIPVRRQAKDETAAHDAPGANPAKEIQDFSPSAHDVPSRQEAVRHGSDHYRRQ